LRSLFYIGAYVSAIISKMLQRLILILSLIASFGLAQIGAISHELSHYADTSVQFQQVNNDENANKRGQPAHNHHCEKCLSYAALGNAVTSSHITFTVASTQNRLTSHQRNSTGVSKLRTYSARAPPVLA